jgi:hypothetical protein
LRCFFFAIRLRRFLMTEPIRPPSLRHNGRRARHHSPAAGRLSARPKFERSVNANRSRSAQAYLLPRSVGTAIPGGRPPVPPAPVAAPALSPSSGDTLLSPEEAQAQPATRFREYRTPTFSCPAAVRHPRKRQSWPKHSSWLLRAAPVTRAQQPVRALRRRCRRRLLAGTG